MKSNNSDDDADNSISDETTVIAGNATKVKPTMKTSLFYKGHYGKGDDVNASSSDSQSYGSFGEDGGTPSPLDSEDPSSSDSSLAAQVISALRRENIKLKGALSRSQEENKNYAKQNKAMFDELLWQSRFRLFVRNLWKRICTCLGFEDTDGDDTNDEDGGSDGGSIDWGRINAMNAGADGEDDRLVV